MRGRYHYLVAIEKLKWGFRFARFAATFSYCARLFGFLIRVLRISRSCSVVFWSAANREQSSVCGRKDTRLPDFKFWPESNSGSSRTNYRQWQISLPPNRARHS